MNLTMESVRRLMDDLADLMPWAKYRGRVGLHLTEFVADEAAYVLRQPPDFWEAGKPKVTILLHPTAMAKLVTAGAIVNPVDLAACCYWAAEQADRQRRPEGRPWPEPPPLSAGRAMPIRGLNMSTS